MKDPINRYAKIEPRQRLLGFFLLLIVIFAVFWYFIYAGETQKLERVKRQQKQALTERNNAQDRVNEGVLHEKRLETLAQDLDSLRAKLPDDPDVPQLLAQLGARARQAGLEIDRFEPKGEQEKDFYAEIVFDMKVHGTYHETAAFIDSIGRMDRILNVTGLTLMSPRNVQQKVILDGAFTMKTYRFVDEHKKEPNKEKGAKK